MIRWTFHICILIRMETQFLDGSSWNATQSFSLIYILNEEGCLLMIKFNSIRNHRRSFRLANDIWTDVAFSFSFSNACHIIKDIHQIYTPQAFWSQFRCHKEIFIIKNRRFHELWPYAVDKLVLYQLHHRTIPVWNLLNYSISTLSALCRVEYQQPSGTSNAMMTRNHSNE